MSHFKKLLKTLHRPKILICAARAGVLDYRRDRDLKRLFKMSAAAPSVKTISTLLAEEDRLETTRRTGQGAYSIQRHVAVLTAIIAEARIASRSIVT